MGKTDSVLDVIGERFDTAPVPTLYVGPTRQFIREQIAPRFDDFLKSTMVLARKLARSKTNALTRKRIAGVSLRLAYGGSSAALKSDPIGLAVTDEVDEMLANVKGAGNPIFLVDQRGHTYSDFVHYAISTPKMGACDVEHDDESGLDFWAEIDAAEIQSAIWRLFQSGTRYHWAWPCPHCGDYFIPRFKLLKWKKDSGPDGKERPSTAALARETAHIDCPRCGCEIQDDHKKAMNDGGVYVAPGQRVAPGGVVIGDPPDSPILSYWVSGLASPFVSFGDRAAAYVTAVRSASQDDIQAVINGDFAELYAPGGGDVPEWRELEKLKPADQPFKIGDAPDWVQAVTLTVDVQTNRLVFTVHGWGARSTTALLDAGEIWGDTVHEAVWDQLSDMVRLGFLGFPFKVVMVDSGFRPGNPKSVPENRVYSWCSRHKSVAMPTKGRQSLAGRPILPSKIDATVNWRGKVERVGIEILHLDTDYFKRALHEKLRWPTDQPGAYLLPEDTPDYFLQQLVAEARVKTPNGKPKWVVRSRENHFFDCEAMQMAAGWYIGAHRFTAPDRDGDARGKAKKRTLAELAAALNG